MNQDPRIIIIAGPNGAGKTTFAREFLPLDAACPHFVNADLIAEGLSPFAPETAVTPAQHVMQQECERLVNERESFAFETTLSGLGYLTSIAKWQAAGYRVKLIFLQLDRADLAIARVAERAFIVGATIEATAIQRDWLSGFENFRKFYAPLVDSWALYDNSGVLPMLLAWHVKGAKTPIEIARDRDLRLSFNALRRAAKRIHDLAMMTGTPIVISRNGVLEHVSTGLEQASITIHEPAPAYE